MGGKIWFYAGSSILALLVASALLAPFIAPHDPAQQNLDQDLLTYSSDHLFGTDKLGRDVLSRTLYVGSVMEHMSKQYIEDIFELRIIFQDLQDRLVC